MQWSRKAGAVLLLLMLVIFPVWAPLTRPGLPAWRAGALPALGLHARALGAAMPAYLPAPALLPARALHALGLSPVLALKVSIVVAVLLLAVGLFLWARIVAGMQAGVLAVVLTLYAPIFLSALYQQAALAALWVMLGVVLVGWGVSLSMARRTKMLHDTGKTPAEQPLHWRRSSLLLLAVGAVLIVANALPVQWAGVQAESRPQFYQLIEAPWFWQTTHINLQTPVAWSLGLGLLALLLTTLWLAEGPVGKWIYRLTLLVGLLLLVAFFAPEPTIPLLAALPLLAVAASGIMALMPQLKQPGLWAGLLLLPVLAAGPGLSPQFVDVHIPETPAAIFGDAQIMLVDARIDGDLAPGQTITLHTTWQALKQPDFDYNLFVHVLDAAGNTVAQLDTQPRAGDTPMTGWTRGALIPNSYELTLPADAPQPLHLRLGLYNWQTLQRLPLASGGDFLELTAHADSARKFVSRKVAKAQSLEEAKKTVNAEMTEKADWRR